MGWGVYAAAWAGLLLTEETKSQPHAPWRSAACSGLGCTGLMGTRGPRQGVQRGPGPWGSRREMLLSEAHGLKRERAGGIRSLARCAGWAQLLRALWDGCGGSGVPEGVVSVSKGRNTTPVTAGTSAGQRWPSGDPW